MSDSWVEIVKMESKMAVEVYGSAPRFDLIVDGSADGTLGLTRQELAKELRKLAAHIVTDEFLIEIGKEVEG